MVKAFIGLAGLTAIGLVLSGCNPPPSVADTNQTVNSTFADGVGDITTVDDAQMQKAANEAAANTVEPPISEAAQFVADHPNDAECATHDEMQERLEKNGWKFVDYAGGGTGTGGLVDKYVDENARELYVDHGSMEDCLR